MEVTAAVLREVGGDFGLEKVHLDAPRPGEAQMRVERVPFSPPRFQKVGPA